MCAARCTMVSAKTTLVRVPEWNWYLVVSVSSGKKTTALSGSLAGVSIWPNPASRILSSGLSGRMRAGRSSSETTASMKACLVTLCSPLGLCSLEFISESILTNCHWSGGIRTLVSS